MIAEKLRKSDVLSVWLLEHREEIRREASRRKVTVEDFLLIILEDALEAYSHENLS